MMRSCPAHRKSSFSPLASLLSISCIVKLFTHRPCPVQPLKSSYDLSSFQRIEGCKGKRTRRVGMLYLSNGAKEDEKKSDQPLEYRVIPLSLPLASNAGRMPLLSEGALGFCLEGRERVNTREKGGSLPLSPFVDSSPPSCPHVFSSKAIISMLRICAGSKKRKREQLATSRVP